jgi:hypothetical protein
MTSQVNVPGDELDPEHLRRSALFDHREGDEPRLAPGAEGKTVRARGTDEGGRRFAIKGRSPRLVRRDGVWRLVLEPIPGSRLPYREEVPVAGITAAWVSVL